MQVGVAAHDAHNVRLLVGGEGLRPGGHWHFDGTIGGATGGLGRVGTIFAEGGRGGLAVGGHGEGLLGGRCEGWIGTGRSLDQLSLGGIDLKMIPQEDVVAGAE